ncbi:MAG TPA: acyl-CoA dehydrogenase family protein, partial [Bacteroidetes bacterium]|nr:acyl-CoA dehydrogenase family protein [Bacteroidota bacterium]
MDYFLTDEQKELQELTRRIANEKVRPVAAKYDRSGEFPWEMVDVFREAGLFAVAIPEEYGGLGMGVFGLALVTEELSKACGGIALSVAGTALGAFPLLIAGSPEQKQRYLTRLAEGEMLAGFC